MALLQPGSQGDASPVDEGTHCMKSIQIRTRKNSVFEYFSRSECSQDYFLIKKIDLPRISF